VLNEALRHEDLIFTMALVGSELSASRLTRFTLGERAPGANRIGGGVDPGPGLDEVRIIDPTETRTPTPPPPVVQPVSCLYTDCATAAPETTQFRSDLVSKFPIQWFESLSAF
jgi:hypothetical protein